VRQAGWLAGSTNLPAAIHIDGDRELGSAVTKALAVMASANG
jgi:hypothetical protein